MTEKAIEVLASENPSDDELKEAISAAIMALKRSTPIAVSEMTHYRGKYMAGTCPVCGEEVSTLAYKSKLTYCANCGQALDWNRKEGGKEMPRKYALWEDGEFAMEGTAAEIADIVCVCREYINQAAREGETIAGHYQVTRSYDVPPATPPWSPSHTYGFFEGDTMVDCGTALELSCRYHVARKSVYGAERDGHLLLRKYRVKKLEKGGKLSHGGQDS